MGLGNLLRPLVAFIVLQGTWVLVVWGAAQGYLWLGPVVVAAMVGFHVWSDGPRHRLWALLAVAVIGGLVDSLHGAVEVLVFVGAPVKWLCPPWIIALWVHFGLTLLGPLDFLRKRWWLASVLGFVGGPLAYAAGVRFGAAEFGLGAVPSMLVLAVVWAAVCPLMVWVMNRWDWLAAARQDDSNDVPSRDPAASQGTAPGQQTTSRRNAAPQRIVRQEITV